MDSSICIKKVEAKDLSLHILPIATQRAFLLCSKMSLFTTMPWYLAGGTAMALQTGCRQSVDLDFFIQKTGFNEKEIIRDFVKTKQWETTLSREGTIYGKLAKGKISLIAYPFFIPSKNRICCGNIKMLLSNDIATMKIIAISQRGRKRDFVDLYWYCLNKEPLKDVIKRAAGQYPGQERNLNHIFKSLTYFDDAESDPMPRIFFKAGWNEIKKFFRNEAVELTRALLF